MPIFKKKSGSKLRDRSGEGSRSNNPSNRKNEIFPVASAPEPAAATPASAMAATHQQQLLQQQQQRQQQHFQHVQQQPQHPQHLQQQQSGRAPATSLPMHMLNQPQMQQQMAAAAQVTYVRGAPAPVLQQQQQQQLRAAHSQPRYGQPPMVASQQTVGVGVSSSLLNPAMGGIPAPAPSVDPRCGPASPGGGASADVAAAPRRQIQPQPQPQKTSPLHVAVGPTMVPIDGTALSGYGEGPKTAAAPASTGFPLGVPADDLGGDNSRGEEPIGARGSVGVDSNLDDDSEGGSGSDSDSDSDSDDGSEMDGELPTVTEAAEDVWRNDADDFVGAAESLRTLHEAILATAEREEDVEERDADANDAGNDGGALGRPRRPRDDFDPAETFLSIQGAALRYHAKWENRLEERDRKRVQKKVRAERSVEEMAAASENDTSTVGVDTSMEDSDVGQGNDEKGFSVMDGGNRHTGSSSPNSALTKEGNNGSSHDEMDSGGSFSTALKVDDADLINTELAARKKSKENENGDDEKKDKEEAEAGAVEEENGTDTESVSDDDSRQWDADEQAAWDVWEEAIGAAAALAMACVGPSWRKQIKRRREWLRNGRTSLLVRRSTSLMSDPHDDAMSVSTVGMGSVAGAAWQAQEQAQTAQMLGQSFRQTLGGTPELEEVGSNPQTGSRLVPGREGTPPRREGTPSPVPANPGTFANWDQPIIPEVLPAAMLRFASSVSEMALPPLRSPDSKISLKISSQRRRQSRADSDGDDSTGSTEGEESCLADAVGRAIWEEQRWLVRRQRVGNAQRDLVLSLCCEASDDRDDSSQGGSSVVRGSGGDGQRSQAINSFGSSNRDGIEWTIAGAHVPVASMLVSWVETAKAGWPTQRSSFDAHAVEKQLATIDSSKESHGLGPLKMDWSRIAKPGAIDWWYVLQVSRAATDLVTTGWRPPPRGKSGENCILGLLEISRRGLILSSKDLKCSRRATDQDAREERLAASSAAAESLSALANIGSRGFLPLPTVPIVAKGLCSLLASIDATMSPISTSTLYPLAQTTDEAEEAELLIEKETFLSQRESCVADIAELLWSLLAHRSSACSAVDALVQFIEMELCSVPTSSHHIDSSGTIATSPSTASISISIKSAKSGESGLSFPGNKKSILAAAGAIRACGAAFWGDPPEVKGVFSLRVFWNKLLSTLNVISSTVNCPSEFHQAEEQGNCLCEQTQPSLVVILEVAVALRRLAEAEFRNVDTLAPDEWEPFLNALENLVPWLDYKLNVDHPQKCPLVPKRTKFLLRRIIFEVRAIFDQTEMFLTRGDIDSSFHCIVDDEYRLKLHMMMLRTACPLLQPSHATNVATSVVKSWCFGGYYLNRGDIWYKITAQVLADAFALYKDDSFGFRGYVHSPSVRLEALLAVTRQYGTSKDIVVDHQRTPTRGRRNRDAKYSQVALTAKVNEMQVERICSFFLPYLNEVLLPNTFSDLLHTSVRVVLEVPPSQRMFAARQHLEGVSESSEEEQALVEKTIIDEFRLRRCAIRILGRLFRILTSDRRIRSNMICTLKVVAKSYCAWSSAQYPWLQEHSRLFEKEGAKKLVMKELLSISLEAISQLEDCLATPFGPRPLTYWSVKEVMDSLCEIIQDVQELPADSTESGDLLLDSASKKLLILAALLPLSRIQVNHDTRAVMKKRSNIVRLVGGNIMVLLDKKKITPSVSNESDDEGGDKNEVAPTFDDYAKNEGQRSEIAPFVYVKIPSHKDAIEREENRAGTTISLDNMLLSIHQLLCQGNENKSSTNVTTGNHDEARGDASASLFSLLDISATDVDNSIATVCYNTLYELLLNGLPVELNEAKYVGEEGNLDSMGSTSMTVVEARSRALSSYGFNLGCSNDTYSKSTPEDWNESLKAYVQALVGLFKNSNAHVVDNASRGTFTLLASVVCATEILEEGGSAPSSPSRELRGNYRETWTHYLCNQLIDRMHALLDSQSDPTSTSTSAAHQDPTIPMLSTIYDIFTLTRTSALCPPASIRLRTVLVCLRLCSSQNCSWNSSQGKVLALQCAGSAIRVMRDNEAQAVLNESMWDMHPSESSGISVHPFESLIIDLLVRRYLALKFVESGSSHGHGEEKSQNEQFVADLTSHESLAKESTDIEIFSVEKDKRATAAWLCGDTLLMCRLGDSKSRHRGWIEVTVRSPTCRLRHLVRLPLCNSIPDPDFPSSLWFLTRSLNKSNSITASTSSTAAADLATEQHNGATATTSTTFGVLKGDSDDEDTGDSKSFFTKDRSEKSKALLEAEAMMRRFEATPNIVGPNFVLPPLNIEDELKELSPQVKSSQREEVIDNGSSDLNDTAKSEVELFDIAHGRKELQAVIAESSNFIVTGRIQEDEKRRHHQRSVSFDRLGVLDDAQVVSKEELESSSEKMTAHCWLKAILGKATKNIERVEEELRTLGFPETLIGSDLGKSQKYEAEGPVVVHRVFEHVQRLQSGRKLDRSVGLLDRTACSLQTHKIALLFAGPGSINVDDETENERTDENILLRATQGSPEFVQFSRGLGDMVMTCHLKYFSGGLDTSKYAADGTFALAWVGDSDECRGYDGSVTAKTMVLFHSVPLMPPGTNNRKRHVGNDVVHVIFAEKDDEAVDGFGRVGNNVDYEEEEDEKGNLGGEFGFIRIIVSPTANTNLTRVTVKARADLDLETSSAVSHLLGTCIFPKEMAPKCVRQLAIRCDIACRSTKAMQDRLGPVSNYEERLDQIKKLSRQALQR